MTLYRREYRVTRLCVLYTRLAPRRTLIFNLRFFRTPRERKTEQPLYSQDQAFQEIAHALEPIQISKLLYGAIMEPQKKER